MKKHNPRVLIISHNCFSKSGSNGRTLANFFRGYPQEKLSQFYIYNEIPDEDVCQNYCRVTDVDVIKSCIPFMHSQMGRVKLNKERTTISSYAKNKEIKRTPLIYLIRNLFWKMKRWQTKDFFNWINQFNPELVLFQAGDASFMFELALSIAKVNEIPLIIYNSESYFFKEKNYLSESLGSDFFYKIFHKDFKKEAYKAIQYASHCIYISEALKKEYDTFFNKKSSVIMTSTTVKYDTLCVKNGFVYLGNLGVGRYESLLEIGEELYAINNDYCLDVYGLCTNEIKEILNTAVGIRYKGVVSYSEVIEIMKRSKLVFHVESFSKFYQWDSRFAFSTKIADCLAVGTCLFVYAPEGIALTDYLIKHDVACVATKKFELREKLEELIISEEKRNYYIKNAIDIAKQNHDLIRNKNKFIDIIQTIGEK